MNLFLHILQPTLLWGGGFLCGVCCAAKWAAEEARQKGATSNPESPKDDPGSALPLSDAFVNGGE